MEDTSPCMNLLLRHGPPPTHVEDITVPHIPAISPSLNEHITLAATSHPRRSTTLPSSSRMSLPYHSTFSINTSEASSPASARTL